MRGKALFLLNSIEGASGPRPICHMQEAPISSGCRYDTVLTCIICLYYCVLVVANNMNSLCISQSRSATCKSRDKLRIFISLITHGCTVHIVHIVGLVLQRNLEL